MENCAQALIAYVIIEDSFVKYKESYDGDEAC